MSRRALTIVAIISFILALATLFVAQKSIDRLMTVQSFPVAAADIPPYTLITADMLQEVELPRPLAKQPVYTSAQALIGKLTTTRIPAGVVIYKTFAVQPAAFRYIDDPSLAVISFPVEPEKAVGGQVRIGQQVDIWRIRRADNGAGKDAESELLAVSVPVVDVRSNKGERAGIITTGGQTQVESATTNQTVKEQVVPLTILTVAVDTDTATKITRLMGEMAGRYEVWVSLSTLDGSNQAAQAVQSTAIAANNEPTALPTEPIQPPTATATLPMVLSGVSANATPTPVPTLVNPTATNTPTPVPTLVNPTATNTPTPVPTLSPPTATPVPTPEWDFAVTIVADDESGSEGPSFVQGTVSDIDGNPLIELPLTLTWDGGSVGTATDGGGTFRFVTNAGAYSISTSAGSTQPVRITIPNNKLSHRVTLDIRQVR